MLEATLRDRLKYLLTPSARSDVPPFMVMDVMAAAARIEAAGGHVIHMEVGQPAASAPGVAIAVATAVSFLVFPGNARRSSIEQSLMIGGGSDTRYALTNRRMRLVWGTWQNSRYRCLMRH